MKMGKRICKLTGVILVLTMLAVMLTSCKMSGGTVSTDGSLTYWRDLGANASQLVVNFGDTRLAQEVQKKTGVTVTYQHPTVGQTEQQFNLLCASGDLPDIIEFRWDKYSGGAAKALQDNIIIPLDLEKQAPNLYKYLKENPEIDRQCKTDDGVYYGFPFIRGDRWLQTSAGIIVRKDWLDDLDLDMPETIDDWTNVLTQFKEKKGATAPLTVNSDAFSATYSAFISAYGIVDDLFIDDGKVKMGALEPGYKDFLKKMNEWYTNGLLDPAFISGATVQENMLNNVSGAAVGSCGSGIGKWTAAAPDDKFKLAGAPTVVPKKGDTREFGNYGYAFDGAVACITKSCKNLESALKLLDYGYSEEGKMLYNFGIEGESYEMKDGYPTYTAAVTDTSDGVSMAVKMSNYTLSSQDGPFIQDKRYMEQYAALPQQQEALSVWSDTNMEAHKMPPAYLSLEQNSKIATKLENVNTYKKEMMMNFISGKVSFDEYDAFVAELKQRGAEEYVDMMNEAYERYLTR